MKTAGNILKHLFRNQIKFGSFNVSFASSISCPILIISACELPALLDINRLIHFNICALVVAMVVKVDRSANPDSVLIFVQILC